jgi:hypothetical protein
MAKRFPLNPRNPQRICWGCDRYCAADSMACGNGSVRAQHPAELFGEDWHEWGLDADPAGTGPPAAPSASATPGSGSPDR